MTLRAFLPRRRSSPTVARRFYTFFSAVTPIYQSGNVILLSDLGVGRPRKRFQSDFDKLEIILSRAAFRAGPIGRDIFPAGTRRNPFGRDSLFFLIDEPADQAHVGLVWSLGGSHSGKSFSVRIVRMLQQVNPMLARPSGVPRAKCVAVSCISRSLISFLMHHDAKPTANQQDLVPPIVLTFAGSDPSGGAGLQADIMTLSSLGCHPLSVITAITVQDSVGVEHVLAVDAGWVSDQARALLKDMSVAAFKIGLLGSIENVAAVASILSDYPQIPLILDPVLSSGRGDKLANEEIIAALSRLLLPRTTILTPNSVEARRLARDEDDDDPDLAACAARLIDAGAEYVLVTGTHEATPKVINTLYGAGGVVRSDDWQRLPGSYHGSGCTLASAIAANLANGLDIDDAVRDAQEYTWQALANGFRPGAGQYLPDRFFWAREVETDARQN